MSYPRRFVFGRAASKGSQTHSSRQAARRRILRGEQLEARLALATDLAQLLEAVSQTTPGVVNETPTVEKYQSDRLTRSIVPGVIVVAFAGDHAPQDLQAQLGKSLQLARLNVGGSVQVSHLFTVEDEVNGIQTLLTLRLGAQQDVLAAGKAIETLPGVAWAQPNFSYGSGPVKEYIPNDPGYSLQYHHGLIQNPTAWNTTLGDPTTVVAVADDGMQMNHPDLVANLYIDPGEIPNNLIDDDANGYVDDVSGWDFVANDNNPAPAAVTDDHGTHIAGIIAAVADNGLGVAGVAPNVRIMPLRWFGVDGGFTSLIISETYRYAANNGADVINTSYNIDSFVGDAVFTAALQFMYNRGVLSINAAGNNNELNPARQAFTQTLLVASTGPTDVRSFDSNYGTGIDISAPGEDILSTITADGYAEYSGTSTAAANAAGVAALIISSRPPLPIPPPFPPPFPPLPTPYTRDQVAALLVGTATNINAQNPTVVGLLGSGRVNSNAALNDPLPPVRINRLMEVPTTLNPSIFPIGRVTVSMAGVFSKATVEAAANWRLVSSGIDGVLGTADDVPVALTRTAPYFIGANDVTFTFPVLAPGQYRFTGLSGGMVDPFGQALDGDSNGVAGGNFIKDFRVVNGTTVFSADFSTPGGAPSDEGFTSFGGLNQWHLSTGRGADPGHTTDDSFYFGAGETGAGGGLYSNFADGILLSPSINLTTFSAPIALEFNHFLSSETGFDFAGVYVLDGASITLIAESGGVLPHHTTGFENVRLNLSSFAGKNIQLVFYFTSDSIIVEEGWYVDDVTVRALVGGTTAAIAGVVYEDTNRNFTLDAGERGLGGVTTYIDVNDNALLDNNLPLNYNSTDTPINIVDSQVITSFLTVSGVTGVISDLNVSLNILHTYDEDLDVFLVTPQGARIELFTDIGTSLDNFTNLILDDEAPNSIVDGVAPFTGPYRPEGQLSLLDGLSPNGMWRLEITDDHAPDSGRLLNWSLNFTGSEPTSITDTSGNYQFAGLLPGTYTIREVIPAGYFQTEASGGHTVTVAAGQFAPNFNFGNGAFPTGIQGTVWNDLNGNRVREAGENGQAGWTVYLDANNNGVFDAVTATLDSTDVPKNIIDFTTVTSQQIVAGLGGVILDANVSLNITHTYDADLDVFLISPTGLRIELTTDNGPGVANFTGTVFDDETALSITAGTAPYTGTFRPETPLSVLDGLNPNGIWRLEITDDAGADQGTLTAWSLQFSVAEDSSGTNGAGDYFFWTLTPGNYIVREVVQPTWTQVLPVSGFHSAVVVGSQVTLGQDFANTQGNSAPLISNVPDASLLEDGTTGPINFTINDLETSVDLLTLSATTSDPALLPLANIVFGGSFANRTVTMTPAANLFGTVTVTLIVTDAGGKTVQDTVVLTVTPVNDAPTFIRGGNQTTGVSSGPQSVSNWATAISPGPANESAQTFSFSVTNNTNPGLFTVLPTVAANGTLTYTVATGANGSATITLVLQDDGGTANGGQNTSVPQSFIITASVPTSLQVTNLTTTRTGFIVDFNNDIDPATPNLYEIEGGGLGPVDITLVGATSGTIRGSAIVDPNRRRLTFVRSTGVLVPDNYTLTLRSAADGFTGPTFGQLDGDSNGIAGGNFVQTFNVPPHQFGVPLASVSMPNFARGPGQAINVPATAATGIPITLSDGTGVNSVEFQLQFDPALLNITAVQQGPDATSVSSSSPTPGVINIQVSKTGGFGPGSKHILNIVANTPSTATYQAKQAVNIVTVTMNGGLIPGDGDNAVQSVAYLGDVTGSGTYTGQDASKVSRVGVGLDSGFAAFKLLDPVIIGDVSGNGLISAADTSRVLQAAIATVVPEIPALPLPAVSLIFGGPDPKLSIPTDLAAQPGEALNIPVMIDSIVDLTGTGLESGDLVLFYDAASLDVTGVSLGSLLDQVPGNWVVASRIDPLAGRVFISVAGKTPLEGFFQGEFVTLQTVVKDSAPAGAIAINLAAGSRDPARYTQLNEGYLTLIPAPTDAANDAVDGLLTISAPPNSSTADQAIAQLVNNQLLVLGTSAADRIIVAPWGQDQLRVRVGSRLLGDFAMPTGIAINGGAGNDYVVLAAETRLAMAASTDDVVFSRGPVAVIEANETNDGPAGDGPAAGSLSAQDAALLQLLAAWDADSGGIASPTGQNNRLVRYGRR